MRETGDALPTVLEKAGIDIALVNTTQLGLGQRDARFKSAPQDFPGRFTVFSW